jgi:TolA-binding protein
MPNTKINGLLKLVFIIILFTLSACTTKKNTRTTRAYHNLTARFNVFFNGNESLKAGLRKTNKTLKDDYSTILPIFKYNSTEAASMLTPEMDRAIQKSAKLIKTHSITVKPKVDKKKKLSKSEREFLNKPEYCNWIDDGYLMMGKAHYFKREFITAEQTFLLIINRFKKEPSKYDAKFWLAKTKIETEDYEDAQVLLKELKKTSKKPKGMSHDINLVYADMYMKQKNYKEAISFLNKSIDEEKDKKIRTRLVYILAQLYHKEENYNEAVVNYNKAIKSSRDYAMTFSAKIKLAEIFEKTKSDGKALKKELKKMVKDDKNYDYLDQIYYALGRIELHEKNIPEAMEYFNLSAAAKSSNKNQKVKTYMVLADYYGKTKKYQLASPYYDSIVGSMKESFPDYEVVYPQMESYAKLMKQLYIISTQDSLQKMAAMPEKERNKLINKKIKEVMAAEKAIAENKQQTNNNYDPFMDQISTRNQPRGGRWYFYNPQAVSYGQTEFKKLWGDRELEDLWRLSNKKAVADFDEEQESNIDSLKTNKDNKTQTPKLSNKTKEYYLENVPLTKEKLAESNKKIQEAMLKAGFVYADELDDKKMAIDILEKLLKRFPETEQRLNVLQLLYNTSKRAADYARANQYKAVIINEYPESLNAKILSDPDYLAKQKKKGKEIESLYKQLYNYYNKEKYYQAINLSDKALSEYPDSKLAVNFQYIKALSYGESGNKVKLKEELELLVLNYPQAKLAKNAKATLSLIESGKFNKKLYVYEPDSLHYYMLIAANEKLDFNKLKFAYQSFNVDNYEQQDLNVYSIELDETRKMIVVLQFKNSGDAQLYYLDVLNQKILREYSLVPYKHFIISYNNYRKFLKDRDTEKYLKFFKEKYQ